SMRARAALTCRSGFARGAQSRTAKLPHTKQPNPFKSLMFAPISPGPVHLHQRKARACDSSATSFARSARGTIVNRAAWALSFYKAGDSSPLALSHDGLWVFANRILADRIFAHGVLADWRRRHRGRLFARQVGGSGNAQRGEEPSRYDDDDLHDANPLVLGTRTGRPSDAPIPLESVQDARFHHPTFRLDRRGGMAPDYLSLWRWIGSNAIGRIGRTRINQMVIGRQRWRSLGSLPPSFYRSAPGYAYLTTADASRYPRTLFFAKGERVCRRAAMHLQILEARGRLTWRYVANGSHSRMKSIRSSVLAEPTTRMEC